MAHAMVRYKYRNAGVNSWTSTTWSGSVKQESEQLVLQAIQKSKPSAEIELIDIRWK